jgi:hypothetical protein
MQQVENSESRIQNPEYGQQKAEYRKPNTKNRICGIGDKRELQRARAEGMTEGYLLWVGVHKYILS